ncbi:MAG TPA: hypothetical protein VKJ65_08255, partial [Phycisphaerae bacterium]|nr:hypothetical protein [Phycisphaerae bacterium]
MKRIRSINFFDLTHRVPLSSIAVSMQRNSHHHRSHKMRHAFALRKKSFLICALAIFAAAQILLTLPPPAHAQQPQPDPAGVNTGDKTSATDAAGNPFVVPEPTDKSAPDYPQAKKAFDDYQSQSAREPLAVKLADDVGHVRISTNFSWTLLTGYLVLFMQAGFA